MPEALYREVRFIKGNQGFTCFETGDLAYALADPEITTGDGEWYRVSNRERSRMTVALLGTDIEYTGREFRESDLWKTRPALKMWEILRDGQHGDCFRATNTSVKGAVVQVMQIMAHHFHMTPPDYPLDAHKCISLAVSPPDRTESIGLGLGRPVSMFGDMVGADFEFVGQYPIHRSYKVPLVLKASEDQKV